MFTLQVLVMLALTTPSSVAPTIQSPAVLNQLWEQELPMVLYEEKGVRGVVWGIDKAGIWGIDLKSGAQKLLRPIEDMAEGEKYPADVPMRGFYVVLNGGKLERHVNEGYDAVPVAPELGKVHFLSASIYHTIVVKQDGRSSMQFYELDPLTGSVVHGPVELERFSGVDQAMADRYPFLVVQYSVPDRAEFRVFLDGLQATPTKYILATLLPGGVIGTEFQENILDGGPYLTYRELPSNRLRRKIERWWSDESAMIIPFGHLLLVKTGSNQWTAFSISDGRVISEYLKQLEGYEFVRKYGHILLAWHKIYGDYERRVSVKAFSAW